MVELNNKEELKEAKTAFTEYLDSDPESVKEPEDFQDWWLPLLSYNLGLSLEGCFNKLDTSLEAISIMLRFL